MSFGSVVRISAVRARTVIGRETGRPEVGPFRVEARVNLGHSGRCPRTVRSMTQPLVVYVQRPPGNGYGIWGVILGGLAFPAIPFMWFLVGLPFAGLSIAAVALGHVGLARAKKIGGVGAASSAVSLGLGYFELANAAVPLLILAFSQ
jgi:hypothetical protein